MSAYVGIHGDGTVAYGDSQLEITQTKEGPWVYVGPKISVSDNYAAYAAWGDLKITPLIRGPIPLEIERVRWDDASWLNKKLQVLTSEEETQNGYDFFLKYYLLDDLNNFVPLEGVYPVAETIKSYTSGPVGPVSRINTHRLYRNDGTFHEWVDLDPKMYNYEDQVKTGETRRERRINKLIGELNATVVGSGGDPVTLLTGLLEPANIFIKTSDPTQILQAVSTAAPALLPVVQQSLQAWIIENE